MPNAGQKHKLLKKMIGFWNCAISKTPIVAWFYLEIVGTILRQTRESIWKQRVKNALSEAEWPDLALMPREVELGAGRKVRLIPHCGEFDFEALLSKNICFESHVFAFLEKSAQKYDTVIEIGANVGVYTLYFKKVASIHGHANNIYSFEPAREAYRRLLNNIKVNNMSTQNIFNAAVSDQSGIRDFFEPEGHLTNGTFDEEFAKIFSVRVAKTHVLSIAAEDIVQLIKKNGTTLLKLDVEGAEVNILKALERFIEERRPDIMLEVLPKYENELNQISFLSRLYTLSLIARDGELITKDKFQADSRFRDYFLRAKM